MLHLQEAHATVPTTKLGQLAKNKKAVDSEWAASTVTILLLISVGGFYILFNIHQNFLHILYVPYHIHIDWW